MNAVVPASSMVKSSYKCRSSCPINTCPKVHLDHRSCRLQCKTVEKRLSSLVEACFRGWLVRIETALSFGRTS